MHRLPILQHPDRRLRIKATAIKHFDEKLADQAEKMLATMYDAKGIGLAGTQVDFHQRLIVIDVSENRDSPIKLVNPEIELIGETVSNEEGCLSIPGVYDAVKRNNRINVSAQSIDGSALEMDAEGLLAICIQHECDHLDGILFIDHLSSLKRKRINEQLKKTPES
tara:strand:+ start:348 stop:845 length:498 start_codon:yes stop_codon:yes gene_type:complete